ncbi:MAG: ATP-binding protein [Rhodocyclaceae bacterium]|nr:ATP-binding protein [Rhodocyclaceae bacterium]
MKRNRLPIGIQTFSIIREEGYYYVDKTAIALQLIEKGTHYFLSRPRRFGKSLFLDTLKELFEGNALLFKGLVAETRWNWEIKYPVIKISFGGGVLKSRAELDERVHEILRDNEKRLKIVCEYKTHPGCLSELIERTHEATGQRVVVLVDEYDKPILDNITDRETARAMRDGLRNLYSVIKDSDAHVKFVFLTGVSKFSKVNLFSGLNNLEDITISPTYSAICGYTEADVDTVFAPELEGLNREEIRHWYNGYNWTGEAVYNPFDLLLLFRNRAFQPYWFETGTPTFLVDLLAENKFFTPDLERLQSSETLLSTFDVDRIAPEALLFQTGYLTIHAVNQPLLGKWVYTLGYPNHEVESSLNNALLSAYGANERALFDAQLRLIDILIANDHLAFKELFQAFFASIPHDWHRKNPIAEYEGYYASIFYSYFAALGLDITVEDTTNKGRIDMSVRFRNRIYLFEFKVVELTPEGRALAQLKAKDYAAKYRADGQPIILIGVEFSKETRNIVGFEVEVEPIPLPISRRQKLLPLQGGGWEGDGESVIQVNSISYKCRATLTPSPP